MEELSANESLRRQIKNEIEKGLPVYAECGGLMYLARSISWEEQQFEMAGALPLDIVMTKRPMGMGYMTFRLPARANGFPQKEQLTVTSFITPRRLISALM